MRKQRVKSKKKNSKKVEKNKFQKDIYKTALKALDKSEFKNIIFKHDDLDKKVKFIVAQTPEDMKAVWRLRKKIFVSEEGYPPKSIRNTFDRGAIHFLAVKNGSEIGAISVYLDNITGLPIEKLFNVDLVKYKDGVMAEVGKLAVLPQYRKGAVSLGLMVVAYEFIKLCDVEKICIFALSDKKKNIELYKKFGFKKTLEFDIFDSKKATCLMLDITKESVYEKVFRMNMRRVNLARHLAEMLSFKIGSGEISPNE